MGFVESDLVLARVDDKFQWGLVQAEEARGFVVKTARGQQVRWNAKRVVLKMPHNGARNAEALVLLDQDTAMAAAGIDIHELWDLVSEETGAFTIEYLSRMVFGDESPRHLGAMVSVLHEQSAYFKATAKNKFKPRPKDLVTQMLAQQQREELHLQGLRDAAMAVNALLDGNDPDPEAYEYAVGLLQDASISEGNPQDEKQFMEFIGLKDPDPAMNALILLKKMGIYSEDENLLLHKFHVKREFPREVLDMANTMVDNIDSLAVKRPFFDRNTRSVAIDDPWTSEVDDALALEEPGPGLFRVHVLIADPAALVGMDTLVGIEALDRASTLYLPDRKILMFPSIISEDAVTLRTDKPVPAIDFQCDLSGSAEIMGFKIKPCMAQLSERLSYEAVEDLLDKGEDGILGRLSMLASGLRQRRIQDGAIVFEYDDVMVRVQDDKPGIFRYFTGSPSRVMVSEFMILAGRLAGEFCELNRIPAIYRQGEPLVEPEEVSDIPKGSREYQYRMVRKIPRARLSIHPGHHYGLGIDAYTQVTSPLRRYQDFLMNHQILSFIYETGSLSSQEIMQTFEDIDARQSNYNLIARSARQYFLLKYIVDKRDKESSAWVVLHARGRTLLTLEETGIFTWVSGIIGKRDEKLVVKIQEIDPRQDILRVSI